MSPSDDAFDSMVRQIRHHSETEMDQWTNFRIATTYGDVFLAFGVCHSPATNRQSG